MKTSNCQCPLKIHERRRRTRHPVRVPILTVDEHTFLMCIIVDEAIKERRRLLRNLKRSGEKTSLKAGLKLLLAIRRELHRS